MQQSSLVQLEKAVPRKIGSALDTGVMFAKQTQELTFEETDLVSRINCGHFGLIKLDGIHSSKKSLLTKTLALYDVELSKQMSSGDHKPDSGLLLKNGTLSLLLGNYERALAVLQAYYQTVPDYWKDSNFMYGLGCVYFYFGMFKWAVKLFRDILYTDPGYCRAGEVHLKLALIYKIRGFHEECLTQLQFVKNDSRRLSVCNSTVDFYTAHTEDKAGNKKKAKDLYLRLTQQDNIANIVKTSAFRQLGWLALNEETSQPADQATPKQDHGERYFKSAVDTDPANGHNYFDLGRCYATQGKVHEAFDSYRLSIDKSEGSANTWCSIGALYQQQSQPMDALQAYICAVQLDKKHAQAWCNLGRLYETCAQFSDALACYVNAVTYDSSMGVKLNPRITMIEEVLKNIPASALIKKGAHQLPSLEDSFSLPIPAELTSRTQQPTPNKRPANMPPPEPKKRKVDDLGAMQQAPAPPSLTHQEWNMLSALQTQQQQGANLTAESQIMLQQLTMKAHEHQRYAHQQQMAVHQQTAAHPQQAAPHPQQTPGHPQQPTAHPPQAAVHAPAVQPGLAHVNPQATATQHNILQDLPSNQDHLDGADNIDLPSDTDILKATEFLMGHIDKNDPNGSDAIKLLLGDNSTTSSPDDVENIVNDDSPKMPLRLSLNMSASEILKECKEVGKTGLSHSDIIAELTKPPTPEYPPYKPLKEDEFYPPTPCIYLENRKDANSTELQEYCMTKPVVVIRGMASVLKMDLGLFSTKTLADQHPEHEIEIRTQKYFDATENLDDKGRQQWPYKSDRKKTQVGHYAKYQSETFVQSLKEEREMSKDSTDSPSRGKLRKTKTIEFGTNVDLSDPVMWRAQLHELKKLPTFCRVTAACNMLSHVGFTILGMNSVQLYMKVPGSRTPGHQENLNGCSVNVNIGPGDCEWFCSPEMYWGYFHQKCEEENLSFLTGSWWPQLDDLRENNIPVFRFVQKPGDLVFINAGTVHWVQAMGWCNNIAWNVCPLTARQYELAVERYEWNKRMNVKSIVPMVHLSWNLARNLKITDPDLFQRIKYALMRSLKQVQQTLDFLETMNKKVTLHEKKADEPAYYCDPCDLEVFNVLLCRAHGNQHKVYCLHCAMKKDPTLSQFTVLQQHSLKELMHVYDAFQPAPQPPTPGKPELPIGSPPKASANRPTPSTPVSSRTVTPALRQSPVSTTAARQSPSTPSTPLPSGAASSGSTTPAADVANIKTEFSHV